MTRVKRNKVAPMQLVGITNATTRASEELEEFWNDPEQDRLRALEQEYEKMKTKMNLTFHRLNILRGNTKVSSGKLASGKRDLGSKKKPGNKHTYSSTMKTKRSVKVKEYLKLKDSLVLQETAIHQLQDKIIEVKVMPANQKRASGIIRGMQSNMKSRLEEISILKDAIFQIVDKS